MKIKLMTNEMLYSASDLSRRVFDMAHASLAADDLKQFVYDYTAFENLNSLVSENKLAVFGAYEEETLCGVVGITNTGQITLLFVDLPYLHRGIARSLMKKAEKHASLIWKLDKCTVNAFPLSAIEIFKHLGYNIYAPVAVSANYAPMEKSIKSEAGIRPFHWKGTLITAAVIFLAIILIGIVFVWYYFK